MKTSNGSVETNSTSFNSPLNRFQRKFIQQKEWQLYLFVLPAVIFFFIHSYIPMAGLQIAFKNYSISKGILASPWIGFTHFEKFIKSPMFSRLMVNTIKLSLYNIVLGFPYPILFALVLNHLRLKGLRRFSQTVAFAPHFISLVVMVGMIYLFLSPSSGVVNVFIEKLGGEPVFFMGSSAWFRPIFVISWIWQHSGYEAIIYLAALSAVDISLYEAATIDGANKIQKILRIDIPAITPTLVTMLLLKVGRMLNVDYQKALLMQTALNQDTSEIIGTYVYKVGLINAQFSYSTAINLFQTVINLALIIAVNKISKKVADESLW
ncbi:ABC transporter permease [Spirochaeta cellobiosiphila]|uniref:ABC transporter permease n=1 Tax=Spirochaeta cellobiosiphila TaxID=504483 RepID=UPI00040C31FC|nr:ABC transporter permease subunit [Spirochaeta cellobiosiphila]